MDANHDRALAAMACLEPLIGEWRMEADFPDAPPGRATFEWTLDRRYVLQRTEVPHPAAPDSIAVIGLAADGTGYLQHYFDARGVVRLYAMTFADGVWTLLRESADFTPLSFSQRFVGTLDAGGAAIRGAWESASDGGAWEHDFDLIYHRIG